MHFSQKSKRKKTQKISLRCLTSGVATSNPCPCAIGKPAVPTPRDPDVSESGWDGVPGWERASSPPRISAPTSRCIPESNRRTPIVHIAAGSGRHCGPSVSTGFRGRSLTVSRVRRNKKANRLTGSQEPGRVTENQKDMPPRPGEHPVAGALRG